MSSKMSRFILAPLFALCAVPVLWVSPAEATFVSCSAGISQALQHFGGGPVSTECVSGFLSTSTDVAGQANFLGNSGVQSNLSWSGNNSGAHAYAFGYRTGGSSGIELIPGCVSDDTRADGIWKGKDCSGNFVVRVGLVVNGN